jgi:hypothetical protein
MSAPWIAPNAPTAPEAAGLSPPALRSPLRRFAAPARAAAELAALAIFVAGLLMVCDALSHISK